MGEKVEAEADYRHAAEVFAELVRLHPAVAEYCKGLGDSHHGLGRVLDDQGRLQEAESEYRKALSLRQMLADDFPSVPGYRSDLAKTHNNLGIVLANYLGRHKEAEDEYRKGLALSQKLADDFPNAPDYPWDLAALHHNLGTLLSNRGRHKEGEDEYRKGLALSQKLADDFPNLPEYRDDLVFRQSSIDGLVRAKLACFPSLSTLRTRQSKIDGTLATSYIRLGFVWEDSQRTDAEAAYRQALTIYEGLTRDFPALPDYRSGLAWCHNNVAYMLYQKRQFQEAEAAYRRALAITEKLIKDFPAIPAYSYQLGHVCVNMGNLVRDSGRPEAALEWYGRSMTTLQATFGKNPETVDERDSLRDASCGQAQALMKLGRDADAVKDWDRAIELDKGRDQPRFRLWRGLALARTQKGDYAKVVADAVTLSQVKVAKDKAVYDAARVCALASAAIKKDAKLADQYATRAVELLGKAREAGYFKEAIDVEHMQKDSDLDSLRSRDDYNKLVADLEAKTTPKGN
jgi:tetratricopeptide (TPR) repeat protein